MSNAVTQSQMFGIVLTIAAYFVGLFLQKKTGWKLCNPLLIAVAIVVCVLLVFRIPREDYEMGGDIIAMLIVPATAVLAIGVHSNLKILRRYAVPVLVGCVVGGVTSVFCVLGCCKLLALDTMLTASLFPKSVTTAIAIDLAETNGGVGSLAALGVFITGVVGAMLAPTFSKWFRIEDPVAQGIAIGACSHALGTTRALELGELQGAMSGLALSVCGVITVILSFFVI